MSSHKQDKEEGIFDSFTQRYALSKTLRFELRPVGKTEALLKEHQVFEKDLTIDASYRNAKFYFDALHRDFIREALSEEHAKGLPFGALEDGFVRYQSLPKKEQRYDPKWKDAQKVFRQSIVALFNQTAENWESKKYAHLFKKKKKGEDDELENEEKSKGIGFIYSKNILPILKERYPKESDAQEQERGNPSLFVEQEDVSGEQRYIFDSFDGLTTYLSNFQETRKNFYSAGGEATAVASRIVQNHLLFLRNQHLFQTYLAKNAENLGLSDQDTVIFSDGYHAGCLLQEGIREYNLVIGSINKRVKELRDQRKSESKTTKKEYCESDYPMLARMKKQILGEVQKHEELITDNKGCLEHFRLFCSETEKRIEEANALMVDLFRGNFSEGFDSIYLNHKALNSLAHVFLSDEQTFLVSLPQRTKKVNPEDPKIAFFISLQDISNALESVKLGMQNGNGDQKPARVFKNRFYESRGKVPAFFDEKDSRSLIEQFLALIEHDWKALFENKLDENGLTERAGFSEALKAAHEYLSRADEGSEDRKEQVAIMKGYADAVLSVWQRLSYFSLEAKNLDDIPTDEDVIFYDRFSFSYEGSSIDIVRSYNAFRNFLTRKPDEKDKLKLNFGKGNLLDGWAESPEGNAQFQGYFLRREGAMYLGISSSSHYLDHVRYPEIGEDTENGYEKMEFQSLDWGKNIVGGQVYPSYTREKLGKRLSFKEHKAVFITPRDHAEFLRELIRDKYVSRYPQLTDFLLQEFESPNVMREAFEQIPVGGITFRKISRDWVEKQCIEETGKKNKNKQLPTLYLFEISNKDLKKKQGQEGMKNIHTLYFERLFSPESKSALDLLGGAEVFFRRPFEKERLPVTTLKNQRTIAHATRLGRYTEGKYLFHLPIGINTAAGKAKSFNQKLNNLLKQKGEAVNIIGIDRGEKHLAYYSVIDQTGNILDSGSLNTIEQKTRGGVLIVDYYTKLRTLEKERLINRQSWEPVVKIKDLKKGYVAAVVRKICDLAIEHNAIVVLENLNMRFKQVRGGIERSVYQQLEKQLMDKLGYLIFKDRESNEIGGALNGYQLAAPFESFQKLVNQTGIMFYTQAAYTSVTDPLTGFRKMFSLKSSWSQKKILDNITKFQSFAWDEAKKSYFFTYNQADFSGEKRKKAKEILSKEWTVYAKVPRIRRELRGGYWQTDQVDPNTLLEELFRLWEFDHVHGDILDQIQERASQKLLGGERPFMGKSRSFFSSIAYIIDGLILQLRNSASKQFVKNKEGTYEEVGADIDFIASPVEPFFATIAAGYVDQSRLSEFEKRYRGVITKKEVFLSTFNGDANGAYNIARKGAIILKERISKNPDKPDLYIGNDDWDRFVQKQYDDEQKK